MVDLGITEFTDLETGEITPEESFTNSYADGVYKSKKVCTSTKQLRVVLNDK